MTAPDWLVQVLRGDHEYQMPIDPEGNTVKNILYVRMFGAEHLAAVVWSEIERRADKFADDNEAAHLSSLNAGDLFDALKAGTP